MIQVLVEERYRDNIRFNDAFEGFKSTVLARKESYVILKNKKDFDPKERVLVIFGISLNWIEEIFSLVNKNVTNQGVKSRINNVILTGQGITNIIKSDVAGKIALNIPVKISTGRAISSVKPEYRTCYALIRYIAARPYTKNVSSRIDTNSKESILKIAITRIKEFFYS